MSDVISQATRWLDYMRENPWLAAGIVAVMVVFYFVTTWKPKATRDAEDRLKEIRDETHDYYRSMRPPGR